MDNLTMPPDELRFEEHTGQRIIVKLTDWNPQYILELWAPDGQSIPLILVDEQDPDRRFSYGPSEHIFEVIELPETGTYTFRMQTYSRMLGEYWLHVLDADIEVTITPTFTPRPYDRNSIMIGETVNDTISANVRDEWYFEGEAGQSIIITMSQNESGLDSYLELWSPNGILIAENDDIEGQINASIGPIELEITGTYMIIAGSYHTSFGAYRLELIDVQSNP